MRKLWIALVSVLLLVGCQEEPVDFEESLKQSLSRPLAASTNHNKPYFKYYLPPDVGVKTSTELGSLLELDGNKMMLNLKVSQVVVSHHDNKMPSLEEVEDDRLLFSDFGNYIDTHENRWQYRINIYDLKNKKYAVILENEFIELVSLATENNFEFMLEHMMTILRSVDVEEERIFTAYSNKEIVEDKAIHEDFFEHVVPEDGSLIDMYNQMHPDDTIEE